MSSYKSPVQLFWQIFVVVLLGCSPVYGQVFISSFSPAFGSAADGTVVTITGSGFSNPVIVKYGGPSGVQDTTAATADGIHIQSQVPASAPVGPAVIYVSCGGFSTQTTNTFYVLGLGPYISDFSPIQGGSGTLVTVNGAHFVNPMTVRFNTGSTNGTIASSQLQFQVRPPAGSTTGFISVTTPNGSYTNTSQMFFLPPAISGFATNRGRAGTNIVISGQNFIGTTAVTIGGVSASFTAPTTNTMISAMIPVNALTGPVIVTAPAGATQTTSNFIVQPTISGFSPGFGSPGIPVTISGANLNAGTNSLVVKFGGVTATHAAPTFSQVMATVPSGATNAPITISTVDGSDVSSQLFYLPAGISGFIPNNSAPGTTVTITGSNFIGTSALTFNGTPAAATNVISNTSMTAVVPVGLLTGPIYVTTPAGTTNSRSLLFYGPPSVTSFSPSHGSTGTNVVITGLNFTGATLVLFGGVSAPGFSVVNNTSISASVPAGAVTGPITVGAPGGTNQSAANFVIDTVSVDLAVSVVDSPDPVFVMSNLVYTIVITNASATAAPNVTLTNTLPPSVNLVAATATQGTLATNANPILGSMGTLNGGASATVTLTVVPTVADTITNLDSVGCSLSDSSPGNNTAMVSTLVWPLPILSITGLTNEVQVMWPGVLSNFTLQFNSALSSSLTWSNDPTPPVLSGSSNVVTETISNRTRFFRLKL